MTPLAYLNGSFIQQDTLTLSFADAGFVFGATVTDFCRTYEGKLFRWPDHLERFRHDCERCHIPLVITNLDLINAATQLVAQHSGDVALLTFATPGPLGYMTGSATNGPPTLGMHTFPIPINRYRRFFTEGVTLAIAGNLMDANIDVKHRSRLAWWLANHRVHATQPTAVPVLLSDNGRSADTAIGAVLAVIDGTVTCATPGTVLDSISVQVVRELCRTLGMPCVSRPIDWLNLHKETISELILTGSAFGLAGVKTLIDKGVSHSFKWPGPITQRLTAAWSSLVGRNLADEFVN